MHKISELSIYIASEKYNLKRNQCLVYETAEEVNCKT